MFWASFYQFATYRGVRTGTFYRLDLDRIHYGKLDLEHELIALAARREDSFPLERVPDEMTCPACGEPLRISETELLSVPQPPATQVTATLV